MPIVCVLLVPLNGHQVCTSFKTYLCDLIIIENVLCFGYAYVHVLKLVDEFDFIMRNGSLMVLIWYFLLLLVHFYFLSK